MKDIKDSNHIVNVLLPKCERTLSMRSRTLQQDISRFIDARSHVLTAQGPSKRLYFSDKEREIFMKSIGLTNEDCKNALETSSFEKNWYKLDKPFHIACLVAIHYYQKNNKRQEMNNVLLIMSLSLYASLHVKYFKFEPNENIMSYTINNLSNKFKIKQLGSLMKVIVYTVTTAHETYALDMKNGTDECLNKYLVAMNTRLNDLLKNIADEFYKNHKLQNYMNTEEDNYSSDNFYLTDNNSMAISKLADNLTIALVTQGLSHRFAEISSRQCQISAPALKSAIIQIMTEYDQEVKELITCILQVYLTEGKHSVQSINSQVFAIRCYEMYLKSNTNDESILRVKFLLDKWLTATSPNYTKTERIATKNNFRRALFFYFVLCIGRIQKES